MTGAGGRVAPSGSETKVNAAGQPALAEGPTTDSAVAPLPAFTEIDTTRDLGGEDERLESPQTVSSIHDGVSAQRESPVQPSHIGLPPAHGGHAPSDRMAHTMATAFAIGKLRRHRRARWTEVPSV